MNTYHINELHFSIPSGWKDNSMQALILPAAEGDKSASEAALVITRDGAHPELLLSQYADQHLVESARRLPGYKLLERRTIEAGGEPAIAVIQLWTPPGQVNVLQRQLIMKSLDLFLSLTLSIRETEKHRMEGVWQGIVRSIQRRKS